MKEFRIERTGKRPLKFEGELIGEASGGISGEEGALPCWTEMAIYRTAGGKYVCEVRSKAIMEMDSLKADVVKTLEEVVEYFEPSPVSRELFDAAGIDDSIRVE